MRGLRWQLLAFVVALSIFTTALFIRSSGDSQPGIVPSATPTLEVTPGVANPTPIPVVNIEANAPAFTEAVIGDVTRLNPVFVTGNDVERDINTLVFEGLTTINAYGEVVPDLAREWVVSSDGLEYVFVLRDDVMWQDGVPFTASDVVYTMSILSDPDFPGDPEQSAFWRTVETQYINQHHVRFRLAQPLGSFPEALRIGMLPHHALQGTNAQQLLSHPFNLSPVGTGPYQLESLLMDNGKIAQVNLQASPNYQERPEAQDGLGLNQIRFRLYDDFETVLAGFETGEVDALATTDPDQRNQLFSQGLHIQTVLAPGVGMLVFNWMDEDLKAFRDARLRSALLIGLNRDSIIERHLINQAVRADSPIPVHSWAYSEDISWPVYNIDLARELLETASVAPIDEDEPLVSFSIMTLDDPALIGVVQEIVTQWSLLNIDVTVDAVDQETYAERLYASDFDMVLIELSNEGSADPDVYKFWHQGQYPDGQNYGGTNDRGISEALERARRESNGTNRKIFYEQFQQVFVDRAIAIPLYNPLFTYALSPRVSGVQLGLLASPSDRFMTVQDWQFNPL